MHKIQTNASHLDSSVKLRQRNATTVGQHLPANTKEKNPSLQATTEDDNFQSSPNITTMKKTQQGLVNMELDQSGLSNDYNFPPPYFTRLRSKG